MFFQRAPGSSSCKDDKAPSNEIDRTQDFQKDENDQRGNWTGRLDYVLATLG